MFKIVGAVIAGVFVGALAMEILRRVKPELLERVEAAAKETKDSFVGAFKEGYQG